MDGVWIPTSEILERSASAEYLLLRDFPSLHRYSAYRYLGGGAFGRVFAAVHGGLGRLEAVKRVQITDPRARRMALDEARVMARFPPHPNLVTLYNAEEGAGAIFLTMQCIEGQPLDSLALPVPIDRALAWTRDAAEALALMHAHGFVHRDIKPGNLFCTVHQHAVLGDFGVARATDSRDRAAAIAGTPAYMAPEAFVGAATTASDLWSLGVMLYELLTGRRPFAEYEALPIDQMAPALAAARLRCPSALRPGVPSRIDDLVLMLLACRPPDRLPSAMALLDFLPRYPTVVSALPADITTLEVDGFAISANEQLAMHVPGSAAHAVLQAGGFGIQAEARAQAPAPVGSVVVTSAGTLRARHVLHAVTSGVDARGYIQRATERDLRRALWSCFRKAHELCFRTLAIPAMGTYTGGISPEEAARMMIDVTHTYLIEFRPRLERVIFALPDKLIALAFREAAIERGMLLV